MKRKETAWKKSRTFGDIHGGRTRLRMEDNIFKKLHNLKRPGVNEELPILIQDNPSRDFFFPIDVYETHEAVKALPKRDYKGITHIWLRKFKKRDYERGLEPLAQFICGHGVRVIILYPWPKDMLLFLGRKKPSRSILKEYGKWSVELHNLKGYWAFKWELAPLRHFYIQHLLYHEVGHHVDLYFRHFSKANLKQVEEFADQYAIQKSATATYVFNGLEKQR